MKTWARSTRTCARSSRSRTRCRSRFRRLRRRKWQRADPADQAFLDLPQLILQIAQCILEGRAMHRRSRGLELARHAAPRQLQALALVPSLDVLGGRFLAACRALKSLALLRLDRLAFEPSGHVSTCVQ